MIWWIAAAIVGVVVVAWLLAPRDVAIVDHKILSENDDRALGRVYSTVGRGFWAQLGVIAPAVDPGSVDEYPRPVDAVSSPHGPTAIFRLPLGLSVDAVRSVRNQLADAWGVNEVVIERPAPGYVAVTLVLRDPLAMSRKPGWTK